MGLVQVFVQFKHQKANRFYMKNFQKEDLEKIKNYNEWELDYLSNGSPIFQCKKFYTFSSDSIALAKSVKVNSGERVADLCAGTGIVGLEVAEHLAEKGIKDVSIDFVELQELVFPLLKENTTINCSGLKLTPFLQSVQDFASDSKNQGVYDTIVCNPPYFKKGSGKIGDNETVAISRHELFLSLEELFNSVAKISKPHSKFFMIHLSSRQNEIIKTASKYGFSLCLSQELSGKLSRTIYQFER